MSSTAAALRRLGVDVVECHGDDPPLDVDLVHGFGLDATQVHCLRCLGKPVAISPIYWDLEYRAAGPGRQQTWRKRMGRVRRAGRFAWASLVGGSALARASLSEVRAELAQIATFSSADVLLPNAAGEREAIVTDLGVATEIIVVPNGVDAHRFTPGPVVGRGSRSVLCVGRIEPHKNQLGLIEALSGLDVDLTIAGPMHPHHERYYRRCVDAAGGSVQFTGWIEDDDLPMHYQSAAVHVLATWFETTGLSSLEAALSGCRIVTTSRGHAAEYFRDEAWYCDPARPESIRQAVVAALEAPTPPQLADRIRRTYTWDHVARATLTAYGTVLRSRPDANRTTTTG